MIADEIIAEIRTRSDIVAVIGQHVQLKKAGRNWKGLCPFHGEKTPSFNVSPDKGFFHCFGCQKHGDVFTFVMELEGKSFVEAAEQLGQRLAIAVPKLDEAPEQRRARGERAAMLDINRLAADFFRATLRHETLGAPGRAYLAKRGVGESTAEEFQLGYGPAEWHALADYLTEKRADLETAAKLGLIAKQPRAGGYYDRYRDRLVCPVIVPGGEIVGFSARTVGSAPPPSSDVHGASEPPKYINSPESVVYKKSRLLFGLAQARRGLQQNGRATLVEGNFDVITLHQAGFIDVVAPLGTALTLEQVQTLKRLTDRVVLVYDGDRAGYKATMQALQICVEAEIEVLVAKRPGHARSGGAGILSDGVDPDSLVSSGGAEQLREAIDRAMGGIEFFCFEVWGKARANADARTRALEDAGRLVAKIQNPLKRDLVIDTLATALEVDRGLVRAAVARARGGSGKNVHSASVQHPNAPPESRAAAPEGAYSRAPQVPPMEEIELVSLLTDHPSLMTSSEADRAFSLLTDETLRAMYSAAREGQSFLELAPQKLPPPTAKLVLSGKYSDHSDPRGQLVAMMQGFEQRKQAIEKAGLQKQLNAARHGVGGTSLTMVGKELIRLQARLAEAQRKGQLELVEQLENEISSNRKQAE